MATSCGGPTAPRAAPELVARPCPGSAALKPRHITAIGGRLWFSAGPSWWARAVDERRYPPPARAPSATSAPAPARPSPSRACKRPRSATPWSSSPTSRQRPRAVADGRHAGGTVRVPTSFRHRGLLSAHPDRLRRPRLLRRRRPRPRPRAVVSDGTTAGTRLVRDFVSGSFARTRGARRNRRRPADPRGPRIGLRPLGSTFGAARFLATSPATPTVPASRPLPSRRHAVSKLPVGETVGATLWHTDLTPYGNELLATFPPRVVPEELTPVGDRAFFRANGDELWVTDGTAAGTRLVRDMGPANSLLHFGLTAFGEGVIFGASGDGHGFEPWVSDGTAEGTRVLDLAPGPEVIPAVTNDGIVDVFRELGGRICSAQTPRPAASVGDRRLRDRQRAGRRPFPLIGSWPQGSPTGRAAALLAYRATSATPRTSDGTRPAPPCCATFPTSTGRPPTASPSAATSTSPPPTRRTTGSCGARTAPPPAPSRWAAMTASRGASPRSARGSSFTPTRRRQPARPGPTAAS